MKANISEAKNNFSSLIDKVKKGKSVVIFDREQPVAQIVPIFFSEDKPLITLISKRGNIRAPLESLAPI